MPRLFRALLSTMSIAAILMVAGCADPLASPSVATPISFSLVPGGTAFGGVSAGGYHTCAVKTDGVVVCWGNLGQGAIATTVPASATSISQVSSGGLYTCGLKADGSVICWGESNTGQLVIPPTATSVTQLATGYYHACALRSDATVVCWGYNSQNQSAVPGGLTAIQQVAAGGLHTCVVKSDGTVLCWGYNGNGQSSVPPAATSVTQVAAGFLHTCALRTDGTVVCWGNNAEGQTTVPPAATSVTQLTAGQYHTCALRTDGTLICWGSGPAGQNTVPASATSVNQVTAGLLHTCAGKTDGTVICWGYNGNGQTNVPAGLNLITTQPQEITFGSTPPGTALVGESYVVEATGGSSGNPVTFSSLSSTTCSLTGNLVEFIAAGSCTIAADQAGSPGYFSAPQATQSMIVLEVNVAPVVSGIALPGSPVQIGTSITVTANFVDGNLLDSHSATLSWDDGALTAGSVSESSGEGIVSGSHAYAEAGVYTVGITVSDGSLSGTRSSGLDLPTYVVVYDPSAGFVTGGGWIDSPVGACLWSGCAADGSTAGKATFGFVSRYKAGAFTPSGNTEFQFKAGGVTFSSARYDWLVVAGARAQYKGEGTINGVGGYGFLLTAVDDTLPGGGGSDRFRIKIWDRSTGEVIYDNKRGASEDSNDATTLGGGSIVIHK